MAADLEKELAELPALSQFREADIMPVAGMLREASQKTYRDLPHFLRTLKYQLWSMGEKGMIARESGKTLGGFLNMVLEIRTAGEREEAQRAREEYDKESKEYLAKPLPELLDMLEEKIEKREIVPRALLDAALYHSIKFLDIYLRSYDKILGRQEMTEEEKQMLKAGQMGRIRDLSHYRNFGEKILQHLGLGALQVLTGEKGGRVENYRWLIRGIFREERVEGEEEVPEPEEGEVENFDDTAALFEALNRNLQGGLYTRPTFELSYNFEFFSRLLLEFFLRRGELKGRISLQAINQLIGRANRMAAFTNRKRYLDLSRELKKGEPSGPLVRSLKTKMFLDIYPDAWQAYETIEERQGESAKALLGELFKIFEEGKSFDKSAARVIGAEDRDIGEALQAKEALETPGKYQLPILALEEAYFKNDKIEGEKMERTFGRLQKIRGEGKKRIIGRSGRDKARGRARFTTDERLRREREKLESLEKQKIKNEEASKEGETKISDADKALVELVRETKGLPADLDREIGRVKNNIRRLQRKRTTERDTKEGEYRIERHADILGSLSQKVGALREGRPVGEVMENLVDIIFEPQS